MLELTKVDSKERIVGIAELAREIWREHYDPIIGREQVDYMLDRFQSSEAVSRQIDEGAEYFTAMDDGERVGYIAVVPDGESDAIMLSKIYVRVESRGRGIGRSMLERMEDLCHQRGIKRMWLTVNRHNKDSIDWYSGMGFQNTGPIVKDIGGGFIMDDFKMEKVVV